MIFFVPLKSRMCWQQVAEGLIAACYILPRVLAWEAFHASKSWRKTTCWPCMWERKKKRKVNCQLVHLKTSVKRDKGHVQPSRRFWSFSTARNFDCTWHNFICTTCNFSTKFCEPHTRCKNRCIISDLSCIFFFGQNLAVNSSGDQTLFPWKATHRYIVL